MGVRVRVHVCVLVCVLVCVCVCVCVCGCGCVGVFISSFCHFFKFLWNSYFLVRITKREMGRDRHSGRERNRQTDREETDRHAEG